MLGRSAGVLSALVLRAGRGEVRWVTAAAAPAAEHGLPRSRSVQEAPASGGGPKRSVDAPADPVEKANRDTSGMSPEEVDEVVHDAVGRAGARATEALGGRAGMLSANPSWHMNQDEPQLRQQHRQGEGGQQQRQQRAGAGDAKGADHPHGHQFGDWTNSMYGNGVQETVKQGPQKAKAALKKMFDPKQAGTPPPVGAASDRDATLEEDAAITAALKGQQYRRDGHHS